MEGRILVAEVLQVCVEAGEQFGGGKSPGSPIEVSSQHPEDCGGVVGAQQRPRGVLIAQPRQAVQVAVDTASLSLRSRPWWHTPTTTVSYGIGSMSGR